MRFSTARISPKAFIQVCGDSVIYQIDEIEAQVRQNRSLEPYLVCTKWRCAGHVDPELWQAPLLQQEEASVSIPFGKLQERVCTSHD